jgi:hypothetical protein
MRAFVGLRAAIIGSSLGLLFSAIPSLGQTVVNGNFDLPTDATDSTSTTATGWILGAAGTNSGQRATFHQPSGNWAFWLQTFEPSGTADQVVTGATAGVNYTFSANWAFELGAASGQFSDPAVDGFNGAAGLNAYMSMTFEDFHGNVLGTADVTNIASGSVPGADNADAYSNTIAGTGLPWIPYSVSGLAPNNTAQVLLEFGWTGGGSDNNTGSQSGFASDAALGVTVPEPATLGLLGIGGISLLSRRRRRIA